jgi:Arc/MetJ family transcription regulator
MAHCTTIEIDEALLEDSRRILGTVGIRDTVEGAMREVVRADRRSRLRRRIQSGEGIDRSEEVFAASRPTQ